jgi:hypothetical protein
MNYNLLLKVSIINFIILSILGVLLRFIVIYPISFITYKNLLHAHSHFAFSAVITLFGTILLIKKFEIEYLYQTKFKYSIVVLIFTAYGMLFAFSYQGYKLVSIIFSTISLLCTIYIYIIIWKNIRHKQHTIILLAYKLLLFFLVVSSIAPFCLGYLMKSNLAYSPIYYNTVYFYLHFQYNGFFIFIIILLVLLDLKKEKDTNKIMLFLYTYASSVILTYTISLLWHNANPIKYTISFIGSALQCISIYFLFQTSKFSFANTYKNKNYLLLFITLCYIAKLVMQLIISIPLFSHSFITNRNIIIAFLHLTLIGVVWLSFYYNATKHIKQWNYHIFVFCIIFITTEVLLFISSILPIQNIANYLFYTSIFFPISLVGIYKHSTKNALDKI